MFDENGNQIDDGQSQNNDDQSAQDTSTETQASVEPKTSLEALESAFLPKDENKPTDAPSADANKETQPPVKQEQPPKVEDDPYKMPEGLQEKSQQRFTKLVEMNQQKDQELQQLKPIQNWLHENFAQHQGGVEALETFANYHNAMITGNYQVAGQILQAQLQQFQLMTGHQLQANPLADYPDLMQQVENFELGEAQALEMARLRQQQAIIQQNNQQQYMAQQQQQYMAQQVQQAEQKIIGMVEQWKKSDIDYPVKEKAIIQYINGLQNVDPSLVPSLIENYYRSLGSIAMPKASSSVVPLRPTGKGAGNAVPKSSLEAMGLALGYDNVN